MKRLYKILLIVGIILIVLFVGAIIFKNRIAKSGLPDYNATVSTLNLQDEVKVYRDKFGIPHIFGKNEEDVYKVTGYIMAQDRFWQMDLLRRVTQGRLSEMFGETFVDTDVILRSLRITEKSKKILKTSDPEVLSALNAYAEGVNQYLIDYKNNLSFEFILLGYEPEKWDPVHSVNLIGYMAWDLETGWNMESVLYKLQNVLSNEKFKEILPEQELSNTPIFHGYNEEINDSSFTQAIETINSITPEIFKASNNWVVAGKKSTTGKPIFAGDMHLGLMIPGIWSQIHQHVEGKLDVTGVILPGQPCVIAGHNEDIAWGMTNVMLDGADFYIETIDTINNKYKYNNEWRDLIVKKEVIKVKDEDVPVERIIKYTHRGPIISGFKKIKDKFVSMRWIGNESSDELRSVYYLNRASNWNEFRDAAKTFIAVSQNIAYADVNGNIGLQCCAGIPIRTGPGYFFAPGETDKYDWKGLVPFDSLPYTYNPDCGYVLSANNQTIGKDYPYYVSEWFDMPNRSRRIEQMLNSKEKLSINDFKAMQNDQHALLTEEMLPIVIKYLDEITDLNETEKKALDILKKHDYNYSKDAVAPLIFESFYITLGENIMKDEMPKELFKEFQTKDLLINYLIDKILKTNQCLLCDDITTDQKETFGDMVKISFRETILNFEKENGKSITETPWGDLHKIAFEHPIGKNKLMDFVFNLNRTYSVGGSYHTVSPYSYDYPFSFTANHGASQRHIYNTANFDESYTVIPTGISDIPKSPHYCDQTEMYIKGEYHDDFTSIEKVKANAVYEATFTPKK
jgi:penicillin amidase